MRLDRPAQEGGYLNAPADAPRVATLDAERTPLSEATRAHIRALAARYPARRTALLPALKAAQAEVGYLPPPLVAEVADLVGVSHAAAAELVAFYTMLHAEKEGDTRVVVCGQLPCAVRGADRLLRDLSDGLGIAPGETTADGAITLERTSECFGACHRAPMARVGDAYHENLDEAATRQLIADLKAGTARTSGESPLDQEDASPSVSATRDADAKPESDSDADASRVLLPHPGRHTPLSLAEYRAEGGYAAWQKALTEMTPEQVIEEVKASGLRGRGGAGFPAGAKWSFIPRGAGAKYVAVNADESEPGTFKDRELMEVEPHRVLEGVALCCYAIGAETAFIYIRGEYVVPADRLEAAIAEAEQAGLLGKGCLGTGVNVTIHVFRGAGAYICGEETALLESLEGRRPMPRSRPPFPAVEGLYRRPTVINNVETLSNVPSIIANGSAWYNGIGNPPRNTGPKIFCLSGRVNRPGNYELPLGAVTVRQLIDEFGGGVIGGRPVKGVLTAGVSAPILTADKLDTRLDYDSVQAAGTMLGSASLIVLDDTVCIVRAAALMEEFFRHESCGKCTPCREGTTWLHKILVRLEQGRGSEADLDLLLSLSGEISGKVLCALGDFATSPVTATIKQYRDEYLEHLRLGRCPFEPW